LLLGLIKFFGLVIRLVLFSEFNLTLQLAVADGSLYPFFALWRPRRADPV
jgi:hypothetical protein